MNPIVIDPPNFDQDAAWRECSEFVEKCGGELDADTRRGVFPAPGLPAHTDYVSWALYQKALDRIGQLECQVALLTGPTPEQLAADDPMNRKPEDHDEGCGEPRGRRYVGMAPDTGEAVYR